MDPTTEEHTPLLATPSHSRLLDLPPELLHGIFSCLSLKGVLAARKTCSVLAAIGVDHFGDEVALVYHGDKFRALRKIVQHESLSKRMRSLFYVVDRYKFLSYEERIDSKTRRSRGLLFSREMMFSRDLLSSSDH
jgi:hypothetical protein